MSKKEIHDALYGRRGSRAHPRSIPEARTADGIVFDSIPEKDRYLLLKALLGERRIRYLELQPRFRVEWQGEWLFNFKADFRYEDLDGQVIVEDVKGFKKSKKTGKMLPRVNRDFNLKRKLLRLLYQVEVKIV